MIGYSVSILILVDQSLELNSFSMILCSLIVSILILVDQSLEPVVDSPVSVVVVFQSLF